MQKTIYLLLMTLTIIGLDCSMIVFAKDSKPEASDATTKNVHVRSLAASCAACHGTNGNSSGNAAKLAGLDRTYFVTQMQAFKSGERVATVMQHHAKGLSSQEIIDLAEYFSIQIPHPPALFPTQNLAPQKLSEKYAN